MQCETLTRAFRFGSLTLPDPDPAAEPEEALRRYEVNYPSLAAATVGTPFTEGDMLVYPVEKAPAKTKG